MEIVAIAVVIMKPSKTIINFQSNDHIHSHVSFARARNSIESVFLSEFKVDGECSIVHLKVEKLELKCILQKKLALTIIING